MAKVGLNKHTPRAALRAAAATVVNFDDAEDNDAKPSQGLKERTKVAKRRAIAQRMLDDPETQKQIFLADAPRHASRLGIDREMIAAGQHTPRGDTLTSKADDAFSQLGPRVGKPQKASARIRMFVEVSANKLNCMEVLEKVALRTNQGTVIVRSDDIPKGDLTPKGAVLHGLNTMLNISEKQELADLGASLLENNGRTMNFKPVAAKVESAVRSGSAPEVAAP